MNGSIYIIKNSVNNKIYIGQTTQNVEDRFKQHLKCLKSNQKQVISKAIKKYGKDKFSFEILEKNISSYKELNERETYFIDKYKSLVPNGYNLCRGGSESRRTPSLSNNQQAEVCNRYREGKSTRDLEKEFKVSYTTIIGVLKSNNVEMRNKTVNLPDRTSKVTREIMEDLYLEKRLLIKDIAKILDVDVRTINRAKNRYKMSRI